MARITGFPTLAASLLWTGAALADPAATPLSPAPLSLLAGFYEAGQSASPDTPVLTASSYQKRAIALGGWGQVELGQTEGPASRLVLTAPARNAAPASTGFNARAAYYSPRLLGFQLGISYAPLRVGYGNGDSPTEHMVEGGIRHEASLGKARLRLTAGGGRARKRADEAALHRSWTAGAQVALSGLTVGTTLREQTPVRGPTTRTWSAGIFYQQPGTMGGWSLAGRLDRVKVGSEPEMDAWTTALRYRWSPKLSLSADLGTMAADGSPAEDTRVLFGTRLRF